jgi:hypothetical protein
MLEPSKVPRFTFHFFGRLAAAERIVRFGHQVAVDLSNLSGSFGEITA